jgi:hypothetical protein
MAIAGATFISKLNKAQVDWGQHRHTTTRKIIPGESYLKIPAADAYRLDITNSKSKARSPEYNFSTADGFLKGKLLASGNQHKKTFAKNFQGKGDLQLLGNWFQHIRAKSGDQIEVKFVTPTKILLTKLP